MAILDKQLEFSDAQAVTATAASTNVIDLDTAAPNIGSSGTPIYIEVRINTECDSAADTATIDVAVQDSANNSDFATLITAPQFTIATALAGAVILRAPIPAKHRRYLRVYYTIGTQNLTAGKFDAFLTTGHN